MSHLYKCIKRSPKEKCKEVCVPSLPHGAEPLHLGGRGQGIFKTQLSREACFSCCPAAGAHPLPRACPPLAALCPFIQGNGPERTTCPCSSKAPRLPFSAFVLLAGPPPAGRRPSPPGPDRPPDQPAQPSQLTRPGTHPPGTARCSWTPGAIPPAWALSGPSFPALTPGCPSPLLAHWVLPWGPTEPWAISFPALTPQPRHAAPCSLYLNHVHAYLVTHK